MRESLVEQIIVSKVNDLNGLPTWKFQGLPACCLIKCLNGS